jgi:hypothetical protein
MHYEHERTWDFYNPDPPGQYAKDLFFSYVNSDNAVMKPMSLDNPGDTAVIMAVWGKDNKRTKSTQKVLKKLAKQYLNFDLFFVELLFNDEESSYEKHIDGDHIIVSGSDKNKDIFQKEALWNIGAKKAKDYKYLIFCDSDIWSDDQFWFYKIRNKLLEDPRTVVQGANLSNDTEDESMSFQTLLGHNLLVENKRKTNPGLIYGMNKSYYDDIDGFNSLFLVSCGDSGFINEAFSSRDYETFLRNFDFFDNNLRKIKEAQPGVVDVEVYHEHHGGWNTRNYANVDFAINAFRKNLSDIIRLGDDGIVEWIEPECKERLICREGSNMKKIKDVKKIFTKLGVKSRPNRIIFNHTPFSTFGIVEEYLSDFFNVFYIGTDGKDIESGVPYDKIECDDTYVLSSKTAFSPDIFVPNKDDFYMSFIRNPHSLLLSDYSFCNQMHSKEEAPIDFVNDNGGILDSVKMKLSNRDYIDWFIDEYELNKFAYAKYYMSLDKYNFVGVSEKMESSIMKLCQNLFIDYKVDNIHYEDESYRIPKKYRKKEAEKALSMQMDRYLSYISYYGL